MAVSYHCPSCHKVSLTALDLSRHMLGRGDKVHRDWIASQGLSYSELLTLQLKSFGGEGFKKLAEVVEKETKVVEK